MVPVVRTSLSLLLTPIDTAIMCVCERMSVCVCVRVGIEYQVYKSRIINSANLSLMLAPIDTAVYLNE